MRQLTLFLAALSIIFQAYSALAQQSTPSAPADVQKVEVIVDSYSFTPDVIKVTAGKPVETAATGMPVPASASTATGTMSW